MNFRKNKKVFVKYGTFFYLVSIFLIKIPPFFLIPFFPSSLLTSHTLARVIILALFLYVLIKNWFDKGEIIKKGREKLLFWFLIYFLFHSASIIMAVNTVSFLQRYKDIVFPGMYLFVALNFLDTKESIIKLFLVASVVNFLYQMIIFWFPNIYSSWGSYLIYDKHFELVSINLKRARIFIETFDEISIPFLMFYIFKGKNVKKNLFYIALLFAIAIPSFFSNFRSRVFMLFVSFLGSLLFIYRGKLLVKLRTFIAFTVAALVSVFILNTVFGFSFVDRFAFKDRREDVETVRQRAKHIEYSVDLASSSYFFGVGIGNYFDNLKLTSRASLSMFRWESRQAEIASISPHNIFAQILSETGLVSLVLYVAMMGYFGLTDYEMIFNKKTPSINKAFIVSFWSLFSYSLFNPTTTLTYNALFWLLRVYI